MLKFIFHIYHLKINFWCVYVNVCVWGGVIYVYTCEFILYRPKGSLSSSGSVHFVFLRCDLICLKLTKQARMAVQQDSGSPCLHLTCSIITVAKYHTWLKMLVLGIEPRSLWLQCWVVLLAWKWIINACALFSWVQWDFVKSGYPCVFSSIDIISICNKKKLAINLTHSYIIFIWYIQGIFFNLMLWI